MPSILELPDEMQQAILIHAIDDIATSRRLPGVCKQWRRLMTEDAEMQQKRLQAVHQFVDAKLAHPPTFAVTNHVGDRLFRSIPHAVVTTAGVSSLGVLMGTLRAWTTLCESLSIDPDSMQCLLHDAAVPYGLMSAASGFLALGYLIGSTVMLGPLGDAPRNFCSSFFEARYEDKVAERTHRLEAKLTEIEAKMQAEQIEPPVRESAPKPG